MEKQSLDYKISEVKKLIHDFENTPDNLKIENVNKINKLINQCDDLIDEYKKMLINPIIPNNISKQTDIEFEEKIKRANEINLILCDNNLSIENMIKLYNELSEIVEWCKKYTDNNDMSVIYVNM